MSVTEIDQFNVFKCIKNHMNIRYMCLFVVQLRLYTKYCLSLTEINPFKSQRRKATVQSCLPFTRLLTLTHVI